METASVSHDEEHQHAVISFADGAKVSLRSSASRYVRQEITKQDLNSAAKVQQNFEISKKKGNKTMVEVILNGASHRAAPFVYSPTFCPEVKKVSPKSQQSASGTVRSQAIHHLIAYFQVGRIT